MSILARPSSVTLAAHRKGPRSSLFAGLLVLSMLTLPGCVESTPDRSSSEVTEKLVPRGATSMTANVDSEAGQRVYAPEFLKLLANPPSSTSPELKPGRRRIGVRASGTVGEYHVTLDLSRQVLRLSVPEDRSYEYPPKPLETPLLPSFSATGLNALEFAPAAALALKAKQFDDGLYASVELATDVGLGRFPAKRDFLLKLLQALGSDSDRSAAVILTAAARLNSQQPQVSAEVAKEAAKLQKEFLANELRSKPLGFYTWSKELASIFQRDRILQTEIEVQTARPLSAALSRDEELLKAYSAILTLTEKLTNSLAWSDLREAARAMKEGQTPSFPEHMSLFPPSRAHETDLIKKLYGAQPIPEGFDLADEMIKRIRAGTLDLKPSAGSGWYDHQTYALEALVVPDLLPEGKHLTLDESYRKELVGLFKALLALTRETHIKQLEVPMAGAAAPPAKVVLHIRPHLTLEPLATYYLRRARSYRFVREVCQQAFDQEGLEHLRRLTAAGPVNLSLMAELRLMEALFHGAYLQTCEQIGMKPEENGSPGSFKDANADRALLGAWLASIPKDPDLGSDIRMMVPVFYDIGRKKTKVWAVLGIATRPLDVSYATLPTVERIEGPGSKPIKPSDVEVVFEGDSHRIAYIATAEVYVSRLLNRKEFRDHCDRYKTYRAIVSNLR